MRENEVDLLSNNYNICQDGANIFGPPMAERYLNDEEGRDRWERGGPGVLNNSSAGHFPCS
jgi:hypothetical protein